MVNDGTPDAPDEGEYLNEGDDRVITTTGEHGIDISTQRMDKLDREALFNVRKHQSDRGTAILPMIIP